MRAVWQQCGSRGSSVAAVWQQGQQWGSSVAALRQQWQQWGSGVAAVWQPWQWCDGSVPCGAAGFSPSPLPPPAAVAPTRAT